MKFVFGFAVIRISTVNFVYFETASVGRAEAFISFARSRKRIFIDTFPRLVRVLGTGTYYLRNYHINRAKTDIANAGNQLQNVNRITRLDPRVLLDVRLYVGTFVCPGVVFASYFAVSL